MRDAAGTLKDALDAQAQTYYETLFNNLVLQGLSLETVEAAVATIISTLEHHLVRLQGWLERSILDKLSAALAKDPSPFKLGRFPSITTSLRVAFLSLFELALLEARVKAQAIIDSLSNPSNPFLKPTLHDGADPVRVDLMLDKKPLVTALLLAYTSQSSACSRAPPRSRSSSP